VGGRSPTDVAGACSLDVTHGFVWSGRLTDSEHPALRVFSDFSETIHRARIEASADMRDVALNLVDAEHFVGVHSAETPPSIESVTSCTHALRVLSTHQTSARSASVEVWLWRDGVSAGLVRVGPIAVMALARVTSVGFLWVALARRERSSPIRRSAELALARSLHAELVEDCIIWSRRRRDASNQPAYAPLEQEVLRWLG
jgi:hypothetical protein